MPLTIKILLTMLGVMVLVAFANVVDFERDRYYTPVLKTTAALTVIAAFAALMEWVWLNM